MREAILEKKACELIRRLGGVSYKWISPGHPGVPDRICVLPGNLIVFIEFKKPGLIDGRSERQWKTGIRLQDLGCTVLLINDLGKLESSLIEMQTVKTKEADVAAGASLEWAKWL